MKRKEKDKLKKISKSQVVKNKILINNNKNLFVILEKMSMKEEQVYEEREFKRDPKKGKKMGTTIEEKKKNVSKSQAEEGTKTLIGSYKMMANKEKEIGKESASLCIYFREGLKVDKNDLLLGANRLLNKKQKRKATKKVRDSLLLDKSYD